MLALSLTVPVHAQTITSPAPAAVAISLYRDSTRDADDAIDLDDLGGFALISETRTIDLPPGRVTIRFEGVASGILPESAILIGPDVAEKNQDRRLLSQRGLLDAFTGQRVIIKRTDPATGRVTEEPGTIRSDPDRVILQTTAGFEALYCSGLAQTLIFPGVPRDLSAKPTLSVLTADQPGGRVTLTLTYLAGNFDWQANYVAQLAPDARSVDLFAWLTMASADDTSFPDARANAIAGRVAREELDDVEDYDDDNGTRYHCWPSGTTTTDLSDSSAIPPPPPPPAPMMMEMAAPMARADSDANIVVTGTRMAQREDLGDLKLYRIPMPVTVAARSQKQVAFLDKPRVPGELLYRSRVDNDDGDIDLLYRVQNRPEAGLGEALPGGQVTLYQQAGARRALVGEARLDDKAVGEEVDLVFGAASNVTLEFDERAEGKGWEQQLLTVRNANPAPIVFEAEFTPSADYRYSRFSARLVERRSVAIWRVTVPANGEASLGYRSTSTDSE